jgi:hypothetical protein
MNYEEHIIYGHMSLLSYWLLYEHEAECFEQGVLHEHEYEQ